MTPTAQCEISKSLICGKLLNMVSQMKAYTSNGENNKFKMELNLKIIASHSNAIIKLSNLSAALCSVYSNGL